MSIYSEMKYEDLDEIEDVVDLCQHHGSKAVHLCYNTRVLHTCMRGRTLAQAAVKLLQVFAFVRNAGL